MNANLLDDRTVEIIRMDTFGFTRKKLLSLDPENRNRHIINWLTLLYHQLVCNRVKPESLDLFTVQYNNILGWMGMARFTKPESDETRAWIETISDRIHFHRFAMGGRPLRDPDLLEKVQREDQPVLHTRMDIDCHVALDGLRSLFNIGSVFRTCEAAGFNSLILGSTPGKEHPGVRKTAMGAHQWVTQEKTDDLAQTLIEKKETGFQIIGIETIKGSRPFYDIPWQNRTIVVFGNEEYGISTHVMEICDEFVHIPMFGRKNSINVANAVSIICFQIAWKLYDR